MPKYHLTPSQRRIVTALFRELDIDPVAKVNFGGEEITEMHLAELITATQGFRFYMNRFGEISINDQFFEDFAKR